MRTLPLTKGKIVRVDDADYASLSQWKWGYLPRSNGRGGYAVRYETRGGTRRTIYMHRQLMGAGPDQLVDHEDGDGLNNQRYNLRLTDTTHNLVNRAVPDRAIPYRGVYPNRFGRSLPYIAQIKAFRKQYHLGSYATQEEAARVYDRHALHFFGSFARLNFPADVDATRALPLYRAIARRLHMQLELPLDSEAAPDLPDAPTRSIDRGESLTLARWRQTAAALAAPAIDLSRIDDLL